MPSFWSSFSVMLSISCFRFSIEFLWWNWLCSDCMFLINPNWSSGTLSSSFNWDLFNESVWTIENWLSLVSLATKRLTGKIVFDRNILICYITSFDLHLKAKFIKNFWVLKFCYFLNFIRMFLKCYEKRKPIDFILKISKRFIPQIKNLMK